LISLLVPPLCVLVCLCLGLRGRSASQVRTDDLTAAMAKPLGDALPGLRIQLAVDDLTTSHWR